MHRALILGMRDYSQKPISRMMREREEDFLTKHHLGHCSNFNEVLIHHRRQSVLDDLLDYLS